MALLLERWSVRWEGGFVNHPGDRLVISWNSLLAVESGRPGWQIQVLRFCMSNCRWLWWLSVHWSRTLIVLCRVPWERVHFSWGSLTFKGHIWQALTQLEAVGSFGSLCPQDYLSGFSWRCINIQACLRHRHREGCDQGIAGLRLWPLLGWTGTAWLVDLSFISSFWPAPPPQNVAYFALFIK